jgi:3-mercaptopyruvate sulfurtransferase SseA
MNKKGFSTIVFLAGLAVFALACQNSSTTTAANVQTVPASQPTTAPAGEPASHDQHSNDAPRITLADAKAAFDAGSAVFIDTRSESNYKTEHIKGAINITQNEVASKVASLPKDKKIIAYCS